jgi:hypothetical protein
MGDSTSDCAKRSRQLKSQLIEKPLVALPPLAGLIATALFLLQGGFGGGHGRFDGLIVTLMLPSIYLIQVIPLPGWILHYDLAYTVALPTLVNTGLIWLAYEIVRVVRRPRPDRDQC